MKCFALTKLVIKKLDIESVGYNLDYLKLFINYYLLGEYIFFHFGTFIELLNMALLSHIV